jgi:microsomal dipeptidase-like Zn-dependent dipeptidase
MLPNITYELLKRGYSEQDIRKILARIFCACFPKRRWSLAK